MAEEKQAKPGNDGPQRIQSWASNLLDILLAHTPGGSNLQKQLEEGGAGILTETPRWGVPESICGLWLHPSMGQGY